MAVRKDSFLRRHLIVLVVVKVVLIVVIKVAFFSEPVKPGVEGTERQLLHVSRHGGIQHE